MGVGRAELWGGGVQAAFDFLEGGGSGQPGNPSGYTLASAAKCPSKASIWKFIHILFEYGIIM